MNKKARYARKDEDRSHEAKWCPKAALYRIQDNVRAYAKICGESHILRALGHSSGVEV